VTYKKDAIKTYEVSFSITTTGGMVTTKGIEINIECPSTVGITGNALATITMAPAIGNGDYDLPSNAFVSANSACPITKYQAT